MVAETLQLMTFAARSVPEGDTQAYAFKLNTLFKELNMVEIPINCISYPFLHEHSAVCSCAQPIKYDLSTTSDSELQVNFSTPMAKIPTDKQRKLHTTKTSFSNSLPTKDNASEEPRAIQRAAVSPDTNQMASLAVQSASMKFLASIEDSILSTALKNQHEITETLDEPLMNRELPATDQTSNTDFIKTTSTSAFNLITENSSSKQKSYSMSPSTNLVQAMSTATTKPSSVKGSPNKSPRPSDAADTPSTKTLPNISEVPTNPRKSPTCCSDSVTYRDFLKKETDWVNYKVFKIRTYGRKKIKNIDNIDFSMIHVMNSDNRILSQSEAKKLFKQTSSLPEFINIYNTDKLKNVAFHDP